MPSYSRFTLILFSLYGILHLILCAATQSPANAVNNEKSIKGIAQVAVLPAHLKPSKKKMHGGRRLIFIGDVHGAFNELVSLLEKVEYSSNDHVVFLGDLVSKGPHSLEVVKLAMRLNASCVVGNHDYELLDWLGYINSAGNSRIDEFTYPEDIPNELVLGVKEHTFAMGFERKAAQWMLQCPYILKVGLVDGKELVAVHAGLFPGKTLEKQDPWTIMNMRNIHEGKPSRKTNNGDAWAHIWNKEQQGAAQPTTVIYGHDARRGLQLRKHTKGLDTGCVKGGQLTAMIYPGEEVVSVKCKQYVQ